MAFEHNVGILCSYITSEFGYDATLDRLYPLSYPEKTPEAARKCIFRTLDKGSQIEKERKFGALWIRSTQDGKWYALVDLWKIARRRFFKGDISSLPTFSKPKKMTLEVASRKYVDYMGLFLERLPRLKIALKISRAGYSAKKNCYEMQVEANPKVFKKAYNYLRGLEDLSSHKEKQLIAIRRVFNQLCAMREINYVDQVIGKQLKSTDTWLERSPSIYSYAVEHQEKTPVEAAKKLWTDLESLRKENQRTLYSELFACLQRLQIQRGISFDFAFSSAKKMMNSLEHLPKYVLERHLKYIGINKEFSQKQLNRLLQLKANLTHLDLRVNGLPEKALLGLKQLKNLQLLFLRKGNFKDSFLTKMLKGRLELRSLGLIECNLESSSLDFLTCIKQIETLDFSGSKLKADAIGEVSKRCKFLNKLNVMGCSEIQGDSLLGLTDNLLLQSVKLDSSPSQNNPLIRASIYHTLSETPK